MAKCFSKSMETRDELSTTSNPKVSKMANWIIADILKYLYYLRAQASRVM